MGIVQKALKIMESEFIKGDGKYNASKLTKDYCRLQLGAEKEEVFAVMFLNSQLELLSFDKLFRGSITETVIPPRAILRRAFEVNAAKMILTHNHPSGNVTPSTSDILITKKFMSLFQEFDCEVVDHIIVSAVDSVSLVELGVIG